MITSRAPQLRTKTSRKIGLIASIAGLVAAGAVSTAAPAQADDSSTLTVVGTSDVFDSNLVQDVIKPGFEAFYKTSTGNDITLNYVSRGTGAAIAFAKAGTASAMLVHAASLENQFVGEGYSAEPFGRAIFFGDYVLLGPASDPAGVLGTGGTTSHDIVGAFQKIAAAGADHEARFVSRGGTPGTTVQEHAIWALTSGVPTCTVSAANGGGTTPSTDSGACPTTVSLPSWYKSTGLTQGPNVQNADACNYSGSGDGDSSNSDCYVFTDKGTFQYLRSETPTKPAGIANLKLVAKDNGADATGGSSLLINSFHAYAINPNKFAGNDNVKINSAGAKAFLDWLTSPAGQTAVGNYLKDDPDGAPFLPSAAPAITYNSLPARFAIGTSLVVKGTLRNVVPGTPNLVGKKVTLSSAPVTPASPLVAVKSATTDQNGAFTLSYAGGQNRRYALSVGGSQQIENGDLNPVFGDLLAPTSVDLGTVNVTPALTTPKATNDRTKHLTVTGRINPKTIGTKGTVELLLRSTNRTGAFRSFGTKPLAAGVTSYKAGWAVPNGSFQYEIRYDNSPYVYTVTTPAQKVTVR